MSVRITNKPVGIDPSLSTASIDSTPQKKPSSKKNKCVSLAARNIQPQEQDKKQRRLHALRAAARTAQKSPPLLIPIKGLRCFTTYTEDHSLLVEKYFNPLMSPPQSVASLLTPL